MTKIEFTIKNDEKGYFGCFSKAGKYSTEILTNIKMKDKLLNPKKHNLKNKEAVINFLKRNGYHNIYGDDNKVNIVTENELDDSVIQEIEEELDIFKKVDLKKNKKIKNKNKINKKIKKLKYKYFHRLNEQLFKYHDLHMNKKKESSPIKTPDCAKYAPNKFYVMKRTLETTKWKTRKGRSPLYGIDKTIYYLEHEHPLKNIGKTFIDMDKQTMRGNLNIYHDLRINTAKPFKKRKYYRTEIKKKLKNQNIYNNNLSSITNSEYLSIDKANINLLKKYEQNIIKSNKKRVTSAKTSTTTRPQTGVNKNLNTLTSNNSKLISTSNSIIGNRNITSISNNLNKLLNEDNSSLESLSESDDSYNIYKGIYKKQIKSCNKDISKIKNMKKIIDKNKFNKTNNKIKEKKERPKSSYVKRILNIKGPDFNKTMTREQYYNLKDKGSVIPFSLPNFKLVRERPLTMVVYERPVYKKYINKELKGITPDMYNDIYKYLDNVNNHKRCITPNFSKINKNYKVNDKNPLPIYMRGVTSRGACETINETNLKMNNFAEGKFITNFTSFWPKKSFNKMVNLNLLNSETFLTHILTNEGKENYIKKSINFYRKNYRELLKEGLYNKFDNVTFKSIKPKINKELDVEKFLKNYKLSDK